MGHLFKYFAILLFALAVHSAIAIERPPAIESFLPERLDVSGHQIVIRSSGAPIVLRGGALADPCCTRRDPKEILALLTDPFKGNVVRIPLEPP